MSSSPITIVSSIFRHLFGLFFRGIMLVHEKAHLKFTLISSMALFVALKWYQQIESTIDSGIHFFFLPSLASKLKLVNLPMDLPPIKLKAFWTSFMALSGLDSYGGGHLTRQDMEMLAKIFSNTSIWIGALLVFVIMATYHALLLREGGGRFKTAPTPTLMGNYFLVAKGVMYLTCRCIPSFVVLGVLVYRFTYFGDPEKIFLMMIIFLLGLNHVSQRVFVYVNSSDLQLSVGNKYVKYLIESFSRRDIFIIAALEFGMRLICLISVILLFSYGLFALVLLGHCLPSFIASWPLAFAACWVVVAFLGALNYTWGAFYVHYWNMEFKDNHPQEKLISVLANYNPFNKKRDLEVAPAVMLKKGNLATEPSPLEKMAGKAKQKNHPAGDTAQDANQATVEDNPSGPKKKKEETWAKSIKELDIPIDPNPVPQKPRPKPPPPPPKPQPKFKW